MLVGADDPNSTSLPPAPAPGEVPLPYVYITATDPSGSESPDSGQSTPGPITFRVGRWQRDMTSSLVVNLFNPAGTATSGDYTGMPGSVTIDANQSYEEFTITPVDDDEFEEAESVFAILQASDIYWLTTAFMAEGQIADNDPDLDIDSDNNNAFDTPGRTPREERMEDDGAKPGKLIAANVDDSDGDGIPDFADGYNLAGGTTNAATTGEQFVPVIIQLPPGIAPANATLKLTYDASDPLDSDILLPAQSESGNYEIADGLLRLWSKPGNQLRDGHSIAAVSNAGHFIPSDTSFAATKLTWGTNNTATIWLEAVQASELFADGRINLSVSVQGESGVVRGDGVNTAEFSFQLDEVMDNGDLVPAGKIELSQPAPIVDVSTYQLSDAHISANNQHLLGDIELVGTVQSSFLDLVEGSTGAIDHLLVYLNDASEPISVSLSVSKASQRSTSLLAPFPFQGSFSFTLDDLTLSPGWNSVTLAARDPITGAVGQTSTAFELLVTPPTTTVPPVDYTGSTLAVGQTAPPKATGGGNLTRYAIEIMGPAGMENAGQISFGQQNRTIGRLGDGRAFVNAHNIPAGQAVPAVTAFISKAQIGLGPFAITVGEIPPYLAGVAVGFGNGGVSLVEGTWQLANMGIWGATGVDVNLAVNLVTGSKVKTAKQSATEMAEGIKALAQLVLKLGLQNTQEQADAFRALITGDTAALGEIGKVWGQRLSWAVELLMNLAVRIDGMSAYEKGQIVGRATFEILMVAIPGDELAKMTKLKFLKKLKTDVTFFKSGVPKQAMDDLGEVGQADSFLNLLMRNKMCFVAGTKVHTSDGLKNIEDIHAGDLVLSRDQQTGEQGYKPVLQTFITHPSKLCHVFYRLESGDQGEIVCTGEHPFYVVKQAAFVPANMIHPGDEFRLAEGGSAMVVSVTTEDALDGRCFTTYNFEVADFHTYFVGEMGIWVHNAGRLCEEFFSMFEQVKVAEHLDDWNAFKRVMQETAAESSRLDPVLLEFSAEVMNRIFVKANGDFTKIPKVSEMKTVMVGRGNSSKVDVHHTAPKAWARKLLENTNLPQYQNLTNAQWEVILDDMPGMLLDKLAHGNLETGVGGFHQILDIEFAIHGSASSNQILLNIETSYRKWDTIGPKVWEVARAWLTQKGVP